MNLYSVLLGIWTFDNVKQQFFFQINTKLKHQEKLSLIT
jgi:hypothetical protein